MLPDGFGRLAGVKVGVHCTLNTLSAIWPGLQCSLAEEVEGAGLGDALEDWLPGAVGAS